MALKIPGIRDQVISETTKNHLSEILLFRHFRRYYFNFDYDWEKLDLIESKYRQVYSTLTSEIEDLSLQPYFQPFFPYKLQKWRHIVVCKLF